MEEQRNFSRVKFQAHTRVEIKGRPYGGELLDISLNGALISFDKVLPLKLDEELQIRIFLSSSSISMSFNASLVHLEENRYGFKFNSCDADSMTHLRKLLEYNLDDQGKVTRELFFLQRRN